MTESYKIVDHTYDVVVVGAGGAGLRATFGCVKLASARPASRRCSRPAATPLQPKAASPPALGNMAEDNWEWHMYDTVKGSDWLGDQDAIEYMVRQAVPSVVELEHYGLPFSPHTRRQDLSAPFGGHMRTSVKRRRNASLRAADRTGHALLHTLYQQSLRHNAEFFIEYFAIDLIMDDEGVCRGVVAWNLDDGTMHRFQAQKVILATGGYGRAYFSCTSAHTCTGDGNGMARRAGLPLRIWNSFSSTRPAFTVPGCLITEGVRGEGGYLTNSEGERFMERYAPTAKDLASRDVVAGP